MNKRFISALLLICMLFTLMLNASAVSYYYDGEDHEYVGNIFKLEVNGELLHPDMPPIVFEDYTVVPVRAVFEEGLGATVKWDAKKQKVTVQYGNDTLIMTINTKMAGLNGRWVTMPIAPKIINGYTMVPTRFVGEKMGMIVDFDAVTDTVKISERKATPSPTPTVTPTVAPTQKPTAKPSASSVPSVSAVVTSVSHELVKNQLKLTIQTNQLAPDYESFALESPDRIVVDVMGSFQKIPSVIKIAKGNVEQVRFGQNETARIVVDVYENLGYSIKREGTKLIVSISFDPDVAPPNQDIFKQITYAYEGGRDYVKFTDVDHGTFQKSGNRITVPVYGNVPTEAAEVSVVGHFGTKMTYTPVDKEEGTVTIHLKTADVEVYAEGEEIRMKSVYKALKRSVMLDAGHGGADSGAVAYNEDETIKAKEKDFNLDVVLRAEKLLTAKGVDVHLIRSKDEYVDFNRVGSISNDAGVSLFVSVHTNSFISEEAHGIETFGYLEAGSVSNGMTSKRLSEILLEELIEGTGAHSRGVKDGRSLAVINSTKMPASLIEIGFISNPEECEKMMTESYRQTLAEAVCDAVLRAFEEMDI